MAKSIFKNKTILIVLAILILCGIITFIALYHMYSNKAPSKAVYVFESYILLKVPKEFSF